MNTPKYPMSALLVTAALLFVPASAAAHCDTLDGPVVTAARQALAEGDVRLALVWVRADDEAEIREAFERSREVRTLGDEARELADLHFFETLVRVHRAGEGAPYTGLKPAGGDLGPIIPLADRALAEGDASALLDRLSAELAEQLEAQFENARAGRDYPPGDVEAGREFVEAYVRYIHYAERAWEAIRQAPEGHFEEHP